MGKRFYIDLCERVGWTFVQGGAAEWIVTQGLDSNSLKVAGVAGLVSVAKCLIAVKIGRRDSASTAPAV